MTLMRPLGYLVLALAVVVAMATGAQADAVFIQSGGDAPIGGGDAAEIAFVEQETGTTGLTLLFKADFPPDSGSGFTATPTADGVDVSWSGLTEPLSFILVVDGTVNPGNPCTDTTEGTVGGSCYSLYGVTADQLFDSNGTQSLLLPSDSGGVSHVLFLSSVPEPGILLLLGTGLVGTLAFSRRRK